MTDSHGGPVATEKTPGARAGGWRVLALAAGIAAAGLSLAALQCEQREIGQFKVHIWLLAINYQFCI